MASAGASPMIRPPDTGRSLLPTNAPSADFLDFFYNSMMSEDNKKIAMDMNVTGVRDVWLEQMPVRRMSATKEKFTDGAIFSIIGYDLSQQQLCHVFWEHASYNAKTIVKLSKKKIEFPVFRGFQLNLKRTVNKKVIIVVDESRRNQFLLAMNRHLREILNLPMKDITYGVDSRLIGKDIFEGRIGSLFIGAGEVRPREFSTLLENHPEIKCVFSYGLLSLNTASYKLYDIEHVYCGYTHDFVVPFLMRFNGTHACLCISTATGDQMNTIFKRWIDGLLPSLVTLVVIFDAESNPDAHEMMAGVEWTKWDPKKRPKNFSMFQNDFPPGFSDCEAAFDIVRKSDGALASLKILNEYVTLFVCPNQPVAASSSH